MQRNTSRNKAIHPYILPFAGGPAKGFDFFIKINGYSLIDKLG